ncbi:MAG: hypothetical protein KF729_09355 [Sandaracinaceae bacterium]|nr:hypothetical protein [Sandaracinaceae bacterium]
MLLAAEGPYVPFVRVHWRGDPNSYVDVFDVPVLTQATDGAPFANVVRLPYPEPATSPFVAAYEPGPSFDAAALPLQVPRWRGGRALRMYDRGECSGAVSWREFAEALATGFDVALLEADEARPAGFWILTYTLRQELFDDRDDFTWTRPYRVRVPGTELRVVVGFSVRGRFIVVDRQLKYHLIDGAIILPDGTREPLPADFASRAEPAIDAGVLAVLAQPLDRRVPLPPAALRCTPGEGADADCFVRFRAAVEQEARASEGSVEPHNLRCVPVASGRDECRFVPNVYRVNHRVDGVEVVLSERPRFFSGADPLVKLLEDEGTCHGARVGPSTPAICVHDALTELHRPGVPMCGDALLPIPD